MSFEGNERVKMRERAVGEMRGWGQSLTKLSSSMQSDPELISADGIRHSSVLSILSAAPGVVCASGQCVCHDSQSW